MKILFLSQRFLFPMDTGGKIRTGNILRELNKRANLTIICNVERPKDDKYIGKIRTICNNFVAVPWTETKRYSVRFYLKILIQSFSRYPISVLNDYSNGLKMAIENELINNKYDLVICDFLQSTLNTQDITGVPRLLFQHNVEAQITKRHLTRSKNIISRLFWTLQHKRMYRHEGEMCREFDGTIVVSEEDKRLIKQWYSAKNIYTIPTGVDTDYYLPSYNVKNVYQLVFTGSMDWLPNDDAIFWFISEIYPEIKKKIPQTNLIIVGRNPSKRIEKIIKQYSDITLTGWVEDTRPYISESSVYIVPIRIGGGTRMKIYEALSMGKALVSTTIGAEGLPITNDVHYLLADNETEFINAVVELLRDPDKRDRLGRTARQLVHNNYRWEIVADKFYNICETVISNNRN